MQHQSEKGAHRHAKRSDKGSDCRVYVGNLDPAWSEADLHFALSVYGKVAHATVCRNSYGYSKAYGFVTFSRPEEASSSYGVLQFKNRLLEVKACIRKNERPPLTKTATNFITPNQKENINLQAVHQTLDSMASSQQFQKSKTVKLNKNSKNFEKSHLTDDQTTIESDSGKITISVIKVTDDFRSRSEEALSNQSSRSEQNHCMKPVSEKPGISRLSKEFYPSRPLTFSPPSTIDELSPSGGYFQPMTNPFLVFHPSYSQSENEVSNIEAPRPSRPRTLSRNSFKISFFTFPGRD